MSQNSASNQTYTDANSWICEAKQSFTSFTGTSEVSGPRAVAHVAIPTFSTDPIVLTRVAQALFRRLFRA